MPGANDNASGVATVLALAELYGDRLEHFDLWCVLPGSEEAQALGMREWVSRHRGELDRSRTLFVDLDKVGAGTVHYARKQGLVFPLTHDARFSDCARRSRASNPPAKEAGPTPPACGYVARTTGDAAAARARGLYRSRA
ncbi:MAG: M28 family peptidase [Actinomycetota bacterium]|nr:M28 family peptidase [Actinomycetota bacterium]